VLDSYPATFQIEDLAGDAGVTPDDVRDYLRSEIERRKRTNNKFASAHAGAI
jgi:hypothetical protein